MLVGPPDVQTVIMHTDMLALGHVELISNLVGLEKKTLHLLHFNPRRASR